MIIIDQVHDEMVSKLRAIKDTCDEMNEQGVGSYDFKSTYLRNRLLPSLMEVFGEDALTEAWFK